MGDRTGGDQTEVRPIEVRRVTVRRVLIAPRGPTVSHARAGMAMFRAGTKTRVRSVLRPVLDLIAAAAQSVVGVRIGRVLRVRAAAVTRDAIRATSSSIRIR